MYRYSNMAQAFMKASLPALESKKDDHPAPWVARRVALNVTERGNFAKVVDAVRIDRRKPENNREARAIHKGEIVAAAQTLDPKTQAIINDGIMSVCETLVAGRKALLMDEEILGVD